MAGNYSKELLSEEDFDDYSIWRFDDQTERYFPLIDLDDPIDDLYDLQFRCVFETRSGTKIKGSVCGVDEVYFIRLFHRGEMIRINRNLPNDIKQRICDLIKQYSEFEFANWREFFPLKFQTNLDHEKVKDFSGVFDLRR